MVGPNGTEYAAKVQVSGRWLELNIGLLGYNSLQKILLKKKKKQYKT